MSDSVTKADPRSACMGCNQPLFGLVKFCPFCGVAQDVSNDAQHSTPHAAAQMKQEQPEERFTKSGHPKQNVERAAGVGAILEQAAPAAATPVDPAPSRSEVVNPVPEAKSVESKTPPQADRPEVAVPKPVEAPPSVPNPPVPPHGDNSKSGGPMKWVMPLVFLGAVYGGWHLFGSPKEPDACQQALDGAATSIQNKQFAQAKALALEAVARCTNDSQGRAKTLLQAAEVALSEEAKCNQAFQLANNQIAEGRLQMASRTLATLSGSCAARPELVAIRAEIEAGRTFSVGKMNEAQAQLANGQFDAARTLVDEAERRDRDNGLIAQTRARIVQGERDATRAAAEAAAQAARDAVVDFPAQPPSDIRTGGPDPVPGPQPPPSGGGTTDASKQLECSIFVRAGESALASNSYDVAMENAESAVKAVPNCRGAQDLYDRARKKKDDFTKRGVVIY